MRTPGDVRHGTAYAFRKRGCRCQECKDAHNEANRRWVANRAARGDKYQRKDRPPPVTTTGVCTSCGVDMLRVRLGEPLCRPCRARSKRAVWVPAVVRQAIYERDQWTCGICMEPVSPGLPSSSPWQATLDHVIPRSRGGSDDQDNLRLTHRYCNTVRSNRAGLTLEELAA